MKFRLGMTYRKISKNNHFLNFKKPVKKLTIDGAFIQKFDSLGEAAKSISNVTKLKTLKQGVKKACNGFKETYKGFRWIWDNQHEA